MMLAIILDIFVAFILAKYLRKLRAQILLAVVGGITSTIVGLIVAEIIAGKENVNAVGAIVLGVFLNPLVTLIGLWYFRRKMRKANGNRALLNTIK
jgi:putative effector of murein hydrolase